MIVQFKVFPVSRLIKMQPQWLL